ncbi:hypothetical protein OOT00_00010 [Desulfobotulus sp. H1]|uniref:Uncharacterized protein n=1 Tax=Desulfobotulus pelophilus TaxID=2823377 RepID=A0ABT3N4I9_9BACT|nr:hypothetical protein [Desulfobotulus pelophilus]MCW7752368.1 hypothetical protein [Desulfobotulus pelophilus]
MTTIPNLNMVIQQGGAVREAHNLKAQPYDSAQAALAVQPEREARRREEVQLSEEASLRAGKDGKDSRRDEQESSGKKNPEEQKKKQDVQHSDGVGSLFTTRA